jgi:hypothetical protein
MHIHVDDGELYPTHPSRADKEAVFPLLIANGVTGVRDMSGGLEQIQQWRTSIELGDLLGPRMLAMGCSRFFQWPIMILKMRSGNFLRALRFDAKGVVMNRASTWWP